MARIVFSSMPSFAVPCLKALQARHEIGLRHGLPVWQPRTLRTQTAVERLRHVCADVYVSAAIGCLFLPDVLALPAYGCLNVHPSLLPRWRGATPVSAAILHADEETGVTLMLMDADLDTGPVLAQVRCRIRRDDMRETLTRRSAELGDGLIIL
jgi:methionyl-tRNA formyltransferase